MLVLFFFFCFFSQLLCAAEPLFIPFLNQYERPFTVLELGRGEHVFWIAKKYDAVCVVTGVKRDLFEKCKGYSNLILLQTSLMPSDIQHLGQCERFDVILSGDVR